MKTSKILALLLIVVFAFSLTLGVTAAQNDPIIAVELKSSTATQVTFDVTIKNNPGFDFCRTDIFYNADVLEFDSYSLAGSIVPSSKVWNPNATKDKDGVPFINCSIASMMEVFEMVPYVRVSGDGVLVSLTFNVIAGASGDANVYAVTKADNFFVKNGADYDYTEPVEKTPVSVTVKNGEIVSTQQPTEPTNPSLPTDPECTHANKLDVVLKEATCGTEGSKSVICADCGVQIETNVKVPATGKHTLETIPGKAATCLEDGLTVGTKCSVCGTVINAQEVIPSAGKHNEVLIEGKPATCGEDGLSDGKKCSVCGEITVAQKVIPATGAHSRVSVPGKPASCGVTGLTDGVNCSVCGLEIVKQEIIPAISEHKYEVISRVESTCKIQGTEKSKCSICGDEKTVPLELKAHTEVEIPAVAPTCTESGLTAGVKCSVCGEILKAQTSDPATGHFFGVWTVSKEATCTAKGLEVRKCACGETEEREIPMKDHTVVVDAAVAATCSKDGLTEGSHCSVCNTVLVAQKVVAKTGDHKNNLVSENDEGKTYKCSVCGETTFVPHEENPPTTDTVVTVAIIALVLMSASALVIFNGKKWTIG